jgi:hypothetical protein
MHVKAAMTDVRSLGYVLDSNEVDPPFAH